MKFSLLLSLNITLLLAAQGAQAQKNRNSEERMRPDNAQDYDMCCADDTLNEPRNTYALAQARVLTLELRLNEYGTQRAIKYLRQGYSLEYVRSKFASSPVSK